VPQHSCLVLRDHAKDLGQPLFLQRLGRKPQAVIERPYAAGEGAVPELGRIAADLHLRSSDGARNLL